MSLDTSHTSNMFINGLDISQLDDDELYSRLQELGSPVGPIVDTTRTVYQKKLFVMLGGQLSDTPAFNGDVDQEEEYSDTEPEVAAAAASGRQTHNRVITETTHKTTTYSTTAASAVSPSSSQLTEARRRMVPLPGESMADSSEVMYDQDLHTPSPRRSLRTVTSSESTTYRRTVNNGKTSTRYATSGGQDTLDGSSGSGKGSSILRVLVKLLFLALIIGIALYFYQNNPTESPFKAIEEMARQALEAASGEEVTLSPEAADQPAPPPPPQQKQVNN